MVFAFSMVMLSAMAPAWPYASPSSYLTTGVTQSGIKQTIIGGYTGVLVNYTNSYSSSFSGFVYLDVVNSAGQTVYWNLTSCPFNAAQKAQCFVAISPSPAAGNYTASVFATTTSSVPVSASSPMKLTL